MFLYRILDAYTYSFICLTNRNILLLITAHYFLLFYFTYVIFERRLRWRGKQYIVFVRQNVPQCWVIKRGHAFE
jgi:hypothetical protein